MERNIGKDRVKLGVVKKLHFFTLEGLISLLFGLSVCGQVSDTNTIVNENSAWATLITYTNYPPTKYTEYVFFEGDSIFEGRSYKKVFKCTDELHENIGFYGLIREQDKKTYFIPYYSKIEYLLYDFSLVEGDTIEFTDPYQYLTEVLYVNEVDSVEINGVIKKRIQLTEYWGGIVDTWIEGIGSLSGILDAFNKLKVGAPTVLLCYFQNNELVYKNPTYSECYYNTVSVQEAINKLNISISPNPTDGQLRITNYELREISTIEIFDVVGKKQKVENKSQNGEIVMDISHLANGVYVLKLEDVNKLINIFKIIKK